MIPTIAMEDSQGQGYIAVARRAAPAASGATLEFTNTYYLAFRDLPEILSAHVTGLRALDFGCGTGRSTRVLIDA